MSQQEQDQSRYTRTLVVKPALSQMYDQLLPTSKSVETACKSQCTHTSAPRHVRAPRSRNFSDCSKAMSEEPEVLNWRWLGTVLGQTECANFFVKTFCLWHKHLENETMLGGHCARFFKMGPIIAVFDLVKYGVNGKTVTCLPLGSNFDNFKNYKFCNFLSQDSIWTIERDL